MTPPNAANISRLMKHSCCKHTVQGLLDIITELEYTVEALKADLHARTDELDQMEQERDEALYDLSRAFL